MKFPLSFFLSVITIMPLYGMINQSQSPIIVPSTEPRLYIQHHYTVLPVKHYKTKNGQHQITHQYKLSNGITGIYTPSDSNHRLELKLLTSPEVIMLSLDNNKIHNNDLISIEDDVKKIYIRNKTRNTVLAALAKKDSFLHIGPKTNPRTPQKTIIIHNVNIPYITVENIAYQRPITNYDLLKNSQFLQSEKITVRQENNTTIKTFTASDCKEMINTEIIIEIFGALQRIKIRPYSAIMQNIKELFIGQENQYITLRSETQNLLAYVLTAQACYII